MKINEIRKLSDAELGKELDNTQRQLLQARMNKVIGTLTDTSQLGKLQNDIARCKTVIRERQIIQDLGSEN